MAWTRREVMSVGVAAAAVAVWPSWSQWDSTLGVWHEAADNENSRLGVGGGPISPRTPVALPRRLFLPECRRGDPTTPACAGGPLMLVALEPLGDPDRVRAHLSGGRTLDLPADASYRGDGPLLQRVQIKSLAAWLRAAELGNVVEGQTQAALESVTPRDLVELLERRSSHRAREQGG